MSDPQEVATPSDPHSAEAPVWRDAWRTFQDPYLGPDTEKFPSPFESFVAGYMAAVRSRDAEVAELKAKIADAIEALSTPMDTTKVLDTHAGRALWKANQADAALAVLGSAPSSVEGGN